MIVHGLMYFGVHSQDKSNFIFDSDSQPSPDIKKWGCKNNICLEAELMMLSSFKVSNFFSKWFKTSYTKNKAKIIVRTISWKSIGIKLFKFEKCLESGLIICWSDNLQIYWNIFWSTGQKLLKTGKFLWRLMVWCSSELQYGCLWKISIMLDVNKMPTRQNVEISAIA